MSQTPLGAPGLRFWLVSLAAVLGIGCTAALGRWQLSRAAQKEALQAEMLAQQQLPALGWDNLTTSLAAGADYSHLLYRAVSVRGQWLPAHTVFLDNRQMHGQPGFYVVTPLQPSAGGPAVLVQRGWVPRNFVDRTALPQIVSPPGEVLLQGRMAPPPGKLYAMGTEQGGAIRQNLDLEAFRVETGLDLLPLSVVQTGAADGPLQRDWPVVTSGVEKHYGYAFQWFALCALITTLYVWFQIVRRYLLPRRRQLDGSR
ncbi:SURF1 family protein [Variovorax sp. HJSM1_2]|uniref:SURF1 family protein n=1 Tax=Variovorax sp. HJSM1_2 TaxID=3366263 RepID=UPI003BDFE8C7